MKDTAGTIALDIHNACRSALWYDADGNHLNRAKALFCCNAPPPNDNSTGAQQVVDATSLNAIEPASGGNSGLQLEIPTSMEAFRSRVIWTARHRRC